MRLSCTKIYGCLLAASLYSAYSLSHFASSILHYQWLTRPCLGETSTQSLLKLRKSFAFILNCPHVLLDHRTLKHYDRPKRRKPFDHRHGVISQKSFKPKILLRKQRVQNGIHKIPLFDHNSQFNPADILTHPFFNIKFIIIIIISSSRCST